LRRKAGIGAVAVPELAGTCRRRLGRTGHRGILRTRPWTHWHAAKFGWMRV
jgi:hypothetical protein